jgi:hypothetical protein
MAWLNTRRLGGNHEQGRFPRRLCGPAALAGSMGSVDEAGSMVRPARPLSPEFALLAACTLLEDDRLDEVAPPLAQRPGFDWQRFVELGAFHGIEQVARQRLEWVLPGAIPSTQVAQSQQRLVRTSALAAAHAKVTAEIVAQLKSADIEALVLKGVALAAQLYAPTPEVRASSDIDILVAPEHLDAADGVLRRAGLARVWPATDPPESARPMFLRLANVFEYGGPTFGEVVELHCRATLNPHALPVGFDELWAASVAVETGYGEVRALAGPLLMQYLCHHLLSQPPHRLKWFGDIVRARRLAGQSDCATYAASYPKPLPLQAARLTDEMLRDFERAIDGAASGQAAGGRGSRDFAWMVGMMERGENMTVERTWSRLPLELRHLRFILRLTPGWRAKGNELLLALADPRDAVSLRLGPRFAPLYALAGPLLALRRFIKRDKSTAES